LSLKSRRLKTALSRKVEMIALKELKSLT